MIYPGDTHQFVLPLMKTDGSDPTVTSAPVITVVRLRDRTAMVSAQAMTLITGSQKVYTYAWDTTGVEDGDYVAIVSYAADGVTVNSRFLDRVRIGDARVTGKVALDATVAKDGTVAKDASVAKAASLSGLPDLVQSIAAILLKVNALPARPADETTLEALGALLNDVKDMSLGTWSIDKTVSPQILTCYRLDGSILGQYVLTNDASATARTLQIPG